MPLSRRRIFGVSCRVSTGHGTGAQSRILFMPANGGGIFRERTGERTERHVVENNEKERNSRRRTERKHTERKPEKKPREGRSGGRSRETVSGTRKRRG